MKRKQLHIFNNFGVTADFFAVSNFCLKSAIFPKAVTMWTKRNLSVWYYNGTKNEYVLTGLQLAMLIEVRH